MRSWSITKVNLCSCLIVHDLKEILSLFFCFSSHFILFYTNIILKTKNLANLYTVRLLIVHSIFIFLILKHRPYPCLRRFLSLQELSFLKIISNNLQFCLQNFFFLVILFDYLMAFRFNCINLSQLIFELRKENQKLSWQQVLFLHYETLIQCR